MKKNKSEIPEKNTKTVFVADDHHMFRQGIVKQIESGTSFLVVGQAADGMEALQQIRELQPDIALLDISMPGMSGLKIVGDCRAQGLATDFIILTIYKEEQCFTQAMDLGAKGYLLKENSFEDLMACMEAVSKGKYFVTPLLSHLMVARHAEIKDLEKRTPSLATLTPSELRVLKLIAMKRNTREIADALFISPRTVETHRANISSKLGLKGMNALLLFALDHKSLLHGEQ